MSSPTIDEAPTLGADLERARLEHRARRIERALAVLRDRRTLGTPGGRSPALEQAMAGFRTELGGVRARLRSIS